MGSTDGPATYCIITGNALVSNALTSYAMYIVGYSSHNTITGDTCTGDGGAVNIVEQVDAQDNDASANDGCVLSHE